MSKMKRYSKLSARKWSRSKLTQLVTSGAPVAIDPFATPAALASLANFVNEF
jgi:hypothetical protein